MSTTIKVNPNIKKNDATNSKVIAEKLKKANQILKEVSLPKDLFQ
jgi:hypothetical protein